MWKNKKSEGGGKWKINNEGKRTRKWAKEITKLDHIKKRKKEKKEWMNEWKNGITHAIKNNWTHERTNELKKERKKN